MTTSTSPTDSVADTATGTSEGETELPGTYKRLRIWPAVLLLAAGIVARFLLHAVEDASPALMMAAGMGPLICTGLVLVWWLAASRARWQERLFGFVVVVAAMIGSTVAADESMRGPALMFFFVPLSGAAFVVGAVIGSRMLSFRRTVIATLLGVCPLAVSTALRNEGMWGNFSLALHWRWEPTPEEQLLANRRAQPAVEARQIATADLDEMVADPEWPAFRGADRSGRQSGVGISSDWTAVPPEELWKIDVGPGWSSFTVAGSLLFTQEQRGPMEAVVCYDAETGREIWTQEVESRFSEAIAGPGPRATPTIAEGGLFVMGAEGIVQRLDLRNGESVWKQDVREVAERDPPTWGFSSSPLIVGGAAVVHAGGAAEKGVLAFDTENGDLRWSAPSGDHSYSSPQLSRIGKEEFILMLTNAGLDLLDPGSGEHRLNYVWEYEGYRSLQPQVLDGNSVLLPTGLGMGTRRIRIQSESGGLAVDELWTSRDLKPDFNDFVVYQGHAYGFDNEIFTCINLESGDRVWKRGRYGKGQVLLLEDPGLLIVSGEYGELVLLEATPAAHTELARMQALEGKTWNHPVVIGDRLYIRNVQEAACYRLPMLSAQEQGATATAAVE